MAVFDVELKDGVSAAAGAAQGALSGLLSAFSDPSGFIDGMAGKLSSLAGALADPAALAGVAAQAISALGDALWKGASAAVGITQQRDALRTTFDALGGGAGAGQKTLDMLDNLSKTLPFTNAQMGTWAKSLMAAGIQGPKLEQAIKAVAASTAIMGETGGAATQKLIKKFAEAGEAGLKVKIDKGTLKQLAAAGVSADDLAKQLGVTPAKLATMSIGADKLGEAMQNALVKKGAGPLATLGLTWDNISGKLQEGISSIFEGLGPDVQALMGEVQSFFAEFNRGSTTANGAKGVVTSVFKEIFAIATNVVKGIHVGFLTVELTFYKVAAAVKPITDKISQMYHAMGSGVAIGVLKGLAVVFGALAIAVAICMVPIILLVAALVGIGYVIYLVIDALVDVVEWFGSLGDSIGDAISSAIAWVGALPGALADMASGAIEAGINFIAGLVNSIASGGSRVVAAVIGVAKGALGALAGALHLGSPSKATYKMGSFTVAGLANSIEDGAADVHDAAKGTGRAAITGTKDGLDGAAGAAGAVGAGAGKSGLSVVVQAGAIVIQSAAGDVMALTEEALAALLERMAIQRGLGAAA